MQNTEAELQGSTHRLTHGMHGPCMALLCCQPCSAAGGRRHAAPAASIWGEIVSPNDFLHYSKSIEHVKCFVYVRKLNLFKEKKLYIFSEV